MDAVEEIKDRISIEDLVGRYVDLKRSGSGLKGLCPFHTEKTPSFYVSPARGTYHCFGCQKGGDAFSFLMEMEHIPFPDALKQLASQTGVALPEREKREPSLRGRFYEANTAAAIFYQAALDTAQGERARRYLHNRGFDRAAIDRFELGYAPDAREALVTELRNAGFDERVMLDAGLTFQDTGEKPRDRFRGRLMFPIRDASGRLSGFGGRALGDAQPKYLNSPQTEIFDKSSVLFGIHLAQDAIRESGRVVLVEGYLDAVRAHISGYPYVVASLGTAVTARQLTQLAKYSGAVILALDPDPAGQAAAARAALTALAEVTKTKGRQPGAAAALDLRIARLPAGGGDPDELIRDDPSLWERALSEAVPAFDFYFDLTLSSLDRSTDAWRQEAIDRLIPLIQQFASSIGWTSTWLQRLSQATGVDAGLLQRSISPSGPTRGRTRQSVPARGQDIVSQTSAHGLTADPSVGVEQALLAMLLKLVVVPDAAAGELGDVRWVQAEHSELAQALLSWRETGNYDYQMFRETLAEDLHEYADSLWSRDAPLPEEGKASVAVAYHVARLRQFRVQSGLARARQMLSELDTGDRAAADQSLTELLAELLEVQQAQDRLSRLIVQSSTVSQRSGND